MTGRDETLMRRIQDAERLARVEVHVTNLGTQMAEHVRSNAAGHAAVMAKLEELTNQHNTLKWRVAGIGAGVGAITAGLAHKGSDFIQWITGKH